MNKIIWIEMVLIGSSILIFRSVWTFLDSIAWASGGVGLAVLLIVGIVAAVLALRSIEARSGKKEEKAGDE
jgi:F0F1-type ATP synthase assembly protein I